MLLREVEYVRAASVEDAIRLLAGHEGARALAGGQTLVSVMKARAASPDVLVDLNRVDALRTISFGPDGHLELGPMATYTQIMASSEVEVARPILAEVCSAIADVQVRNRGTIGGNICANDPTNHLPPLLVALGAEMTIQGRSGERTIRADDFFLGVYLTAVGEGELLTKISLPPAAPHGVGDSFSAITIGRDGTCIVNAAASIGPGGLRIALGCVGATPVRATAMEEALASGDYSEARVHTASSGLGASLDPPGDVHASADYRRHLAVVCAQRAVLQAGERARS